MTKVMKTLKSKPTSPMHNSPRRSMFNAYGKSKCIVIHVMRVQELNDEIKKASEKKKRGRPPSQAVERRVTRSLPVM